MLRRSDNSKSFQVHIDWSSLGLGAVLTQNDDSGQKHIVAYASQNNNTVEANYSSYEGEVLVGGVGNCPFSTIFF